MKAGWSNLALGQQCAWALRGDFSVPDRDDSVHCWEGGHVHGGNDVGTEHWEGEEFAGHLLRPAGHESCV